MIFDVIVTTTGEMAWKLQFIALVWMWMAQAFFWTLYSPVNWRYHFVGRALFGQSSALLFMYTSVLVSRIFEFRGEDGLRTGAYFIMAIALTNMSVAIWKQQHLEHIGNDEEETS